MEPVGPEPLRLLLADDHRVVRSGLRMVLEAEEDLEVVGEAGDAEEAVRLVRSLQPDVLVLDLMMPGGGGLGALPRVREEAPDTRVVVLTMEDDPAFARAALSGGASGFVLKEAADVELVLAIRTAANGSTYLNPQLGARLAAAPPEASGPPDGLTAREVSILRLIALGHTNVEIAEQLFLSVRTVETHRAHVQQKTRRTTRADLVRYALDHGMLDG